MSTSLTQPEPDPDPDPDSDGDPDQDLPQISPSKVVQLIFLSREGRRGEAELAGFAEGLTQDELAEITAIAWIGRGVFEPGDFAEALATAQRGATVPGMDYLTGMPHLAENLEYGLEALGIDVTGEEVDLL